MAYRREIKVLLTETKWHEFDMRQARTLLHALLALSLL